MSSIGGQLEFLAAEITERHAKRNPQAFARYGPIGRIRCREDARYHLQYLDAAIDAGAPAFFLDYVAWAKIVLVSRNVPAADLVANLRVVEEVLRERLADPRPASDMLREAIRALPSMPDDAPSFIEDSNPTAELAREYLRTLLHSERRNAARLIDEAIDSGISPRQIYRGVFEPVQREIGRLWQINKITVAQEHYCSAATQLIMANVYSRLAARDGHGRRLVATCPGGEQHEIGLRIITDLLDLEGWTTMFLGANTPASAVVQMCVDQKADVLLVSATTAPNVPAVAELIRVFRREPKLKDARIVVGGRAFATDPGLWQRLGADAYARNADECLEVVEGLAVKD